MLMPVSMSGAAPLTVAMALDIHHHETFISNFRKALIGYVLLTALGCAVLAWWAVRQGLKPLTAMQEKAALIGSGQLDVRMPVDEGPSELAELAASLNAMLARLQGAFERLTRFSSDIAHELRTPLSNLLTQTQVGLSQPRSTADYQEILASNSEELERLSRTVADMLLLAKAEHGRLLPSREPVALGHEVRALFEFYEALADDRGVTLHASGDATVMGDRLMLRRAVSNLLSNALRYTPRAGTVEVRIDERGGEVRLAVENNGTPIAPDVMERLFERFYRAEQDRSHSIGEGEGAGLGLAITQAIVQAHGGRIQAYAEAEGNVFEIFLPPSAN
jgi:two-component system heavy metal sensor histidine kinase CusS